MPAIKATLVGLKKLDEAIKRAELRTRAAARTAVDETSRRTQLAIRKDVNRIFSGGTIRQRRGKGRDRKSTRLNSSHIPLPRMPSSASKKKPSPS